jgi:hypothetical protein
MIVFEVILTPRTRRLRTRPLGPEGLGNVPPVLDENGMRREARTRPLLRRLPSELLVEASSSVVLLEDAQPRLRHTLVCQRSEKSIVCRCRHAGAPRLDGSAEVQQLIVAGGGETQYFIVVVRNDVGTDPRVGELRDPARPQCFSWKGMSVLGKNVRQGASCALFLDREERIEVGLGCLPEIHATIFADRPGGRGTVIGVDHGRQGGGAVFFASDDNTGMLIINYPTSEPHEPARLRLLVRWSLTV